MTRCALCGVQCGGMDEDVKSSPYHCDYCDRIICWECFRDYEVPDDFHPEIERRAYEGYLRLCDQCADELIFGFKARTGLRKEKTKDVN